MKILIVCVNYNSYLKLNEYLVSLDRSATSSHDYVDVIVADNSDSIEELNQEFDNLSIIHISTKKNIGYLGAVAFAIKESGIEINRFEYCIISNVDLKVDNSFFTGLKLKKYNKSVGCIAPSIFSLVENRDKNPELVKRPTRRKMQLLKLMYSVPILYLLYFKLVYRRKRKKNNILLEHKVIYAPHGSFMIFTSSFSEFIQNFRYKSFLFGEEIFFGENLRRFNLKTIYEPDLKIIDSEHESTSKLRKKTFFNWNIDALSMLLKEYFYE